jgi:hypothetical protein
VFQDVKLEKANQRAKIQGRGKSGKKGKCPFFTFALSATHLDLSLHLENHPSLPFFRGSKE